MNGNEIRELPLIVAKMLDPISLAISSVLGALDEGISKTPQMISGRYRKFQGHNKIFSTLWQRYINAVFQ